MDRDIQEVAATTASRVTLEIACWKATRGMTSWRAAQGMTAVQEVGEMTASRVIRATIG